jgi:hypothetical protein
MLLLQHAWQPHLRLLQMLLQQQQHLLRPALELSCSAAVAPSAGSLVLLLQELRPMQQPLPASSHQAMKAVAYGPAIAEAHHQTLLLLLLLLLNQGQLAQTSQQQ